MWTYKLKDFKGGWIYGNFEPTLHPSRETEVGYHRYHKNQYTVPHKHKIATEINLITHGSMSINGKMLNDGDIFILFPGEYSKAHFLTDVEILVIKYPSIPSDKYAN